MPIRPDFKHTAEPQKTGKRRIGPIRLALLLSLSAMVAFFIGNAPQGPSRDDLLEKPMAATNPSPKPQRSDPREPDPGSLTEQRQSTPAAHYKAEPKKQNLPGKPATQDAEREKDMGKGESTAARHGQSSESPERRYDFYRMLRDYEVVIPEEETARPSKPNMDPRERPRGRIAPRPKAGVYMLQVGSFRTRAQAEAMRAELALLGLEAIIKTARDTDGQFRQRVQVGPYGDAAERNAVIENLEANGHRPILVKPVP